MKICEWKDRVLAGLHDVNANEITAQIENNNLSQWCEAWRNSISRDIDNIPIIRCKGCTRFKQFGNKYGECVRQNAKLTVKETDFCSCAERKYGYDDYLDHKYSGLVDE